MRSTISFKKSLVVIGLAIVMLLGAITVSALGNKPYNYQSQGINLHNWSHFVGNVPGTGAYKVKKGRYVKQAWVRIKEGKNYDRRDWSEALTKKSKKLAQAEIKCFNNPAKSQTLSYGWKLN